MVEAEWTRNTLSVRELVAIKRERERAAGKGDVDHDLIWDAVEALDRRQSKIETLMEDVAAGVTFLVRAAKYGGPVAAALMALSQLM